MNEELAIVAGMFKANAGILEKAMQAVPAEKWLSQPAEASNHLLWIAGHIVVHRAMVLKMLGGAWSAPWEKTFVRGAAQAASEAYPQVAEIRRAWDEVSSQLYPLLASPPPNVLGKPAAEKVPSFNGKVSGTIAFLGFHEAYHVGQVAYLKKWLGHGQSVG